MLDARFLHVTSLVQLNLHEKLNHFLLSTIFLKLHNKTTCNVALATCFAMLCKSTNYSPQTSSNL